MEREATRAFAVFRARELLVKPSDTCAFSKSATGWSSGVKFARGVERALSAHLENQGAMVAQTLRLVRCHDRAGADP